MYREVAEEPFNEFHFETSRKLAERLGYPSDAKETEMSTTERASTLRNSSSQGSSAQPNARFSSIQVIV